ncbi:MAG TPA: hypothetical protein VK141_05360, partial [Nitrosomonas sp.]|nr:hypothetical protein [Nitrosomonas sp.]
MNAHLVVSLAFSAVLVCGCKEESRSSQRSSAGSVNVTKFVKHEVVDNQATHMVVSTYLLPEHWTVQDTFMW